MNYDLPNEITNSQCWYLQSPYQIVAYPNNRTRRTYIRSGSRWYLQNTQTTSSSYGYDWSGYNCLQTTQLEYEYSYNGVFYDFVAGIIAGIAIFWAVKLIVGRFFKGGSKW